MSKRKIIVTGGAGYIGSHTVVELARNGYEPIIVDNLSNSYSEVIDWLTEITGSRPKFYKLDCSDYDAFRKVFEENNIYGFIHFAACKSVNESVQEPILYYKNNIGSLTTSLQLMKEFDVNNLVFSSSCTVYGIPQSDIQVTEETPLQKPNSPYGHTKLICEQIIQDVSNVSNIGSVLLRYFNPIGAHESTKIGELPIGKPNNLVPFVAQTAAGIREKLSIFGKDYETDDGTCIRDFIHVSDLANAHVKAIEYLPSQKENTSIFNLGTGEGSSVLEIVNTFMRVTGQDINFEFVPRREGDVPAIFANANKAESLLNWKCKYSLEDSLASAWNWQKHLNKINFRIEK